MPYGCSPSEATRAKIAASLRGRVRSLESIAKTAKANTGRKRSDATRARMLLVQKGRVITPEHRAKIAATLTGRPLSQQARDAQRSAWAAKTYEERLRASAPGRASAHPERNDGASLRRWWRGLDPSALAAVKEHRAAGQRASWEVMTPEQRRARTEPGLVLATRASRLTHPTSIERAIAALLDSLGVAYVAEHTIGRYSVDFFVPSRSLVVECDGSYWHSKPNVKARDQRRDEWLSGLGYTVLRLSEPDIRAGAFGPLLARLAG